MAMGIRGFRESSLQMARVAEFAGSQSPWAIARESDLAPFVHTWAAFAPGSPVIITIAALPGTAPYE